jgi:hypothetical protein
VLAHGGREQRPECALSIGIKTMAKTSSCCGPEKMCSLTCCSCGIDLKVIKPLVNAPKFICKACGRVANRKENLCKPVRLA